MLIIIIKDNGDTESVQLSIEQATEISGVLLNDERAVVSNFGCKMQVNGVYRSSGTTGRIETVGLHSESPTSIR